MKILITGANGFLGHYLIQLLLNKEYDVIATGRGDCRLPFADNSRFSYEEMDFTDPLAVKDIFSRYKPAVVIHAGAISKPDDCENDRQLAYRTNVTGTELLVRQASSFKSFFIFLSTDFIFDGERGMYVEDDLPNPVNFYGSTKAGAEEVVRAYDFDWSIVRTVLVYGKPLTGRANLLSIVKEKLEKGEEYKVVNDQVRTPTYVGDLAKGILSIIEKRAKGIYHIAGKDVLTPYEMACTIADFLGLEGSFLKKVTAADFAEVAKRPLVTGFVIDKARQQLGYEPVSFEEGLKLTFGSE